MLIRSRVLIERMPKCRYLINKDFTALKIAKLKKKQRKKTDQKSEAWHRMMSRRIWEDFWMESIPAGHHIHHIDRDYTNICISNLICLSREQHVYRHQGII